MRLNMIRLSSSPPRWPQDASRAKSVPGPGQDPATPHHSGHDSVANGSSPLTLASVTPASRLKTLRAPGWISNQANYQLRHATRASTMARAAQRRWPSRRQAPHAYALRGATRPRRWLHQQVMPVVTARPQQQPRRRCNLRPTMANVASRSVHPLRRHCRMLQPTMIAAPAGYDCDVRPEIRPYPSRRFAAAWGVVASSGHGLWSRCR